jgi:nicotinate-nucleotide--dimethylbenzimidazole phosphoribosyltransferase
MLEHLRLRPLLDLDMRLGEGTGAALGIFLAETAARLLAEMATFGEAGVSERSEPVR